MYREFKPCSWLAPYIDKYWEFKGKLPFGTHINILPDGCTDFIFTLGEPTQGEEPKSLIMQPYRSYFVGPMTKYSRLVVCTETVHMLGIRFLPYGLFHFMELPLEELKDCRTPANELNLLFDDLFTEQLLEKQGLKEQIALIEELLLKALIKRDRQDPFVTCAINDIHHSCGKFPVQTLLERVCISQRSLERKFKHYTGYTPKAYSRIVKFRYAVGLLQQGITRNLLDVAIEAGYYDVSHLVKEVKVLSGTTPASFLAVNCPADTTLTYLES